MLILSLSENESILIGKEIKITVLSIKGNQVKLGIDAPKEIPIERDDMKTVKPKE